MADKPFITHLLVDLDGTLYPITAENDYEHHVRSNVFKFMHERLGVPEADAVGIWQQAFAKYNQSLKGLRETGYKFDTEEYWDFIRRGAEEFLTPDPQVRELFKRLPQKRWLFTNANEKSALECLKLLNLEGIFDGIIGADSMGEICKPEPEAFQIALRRCHARAENTAMFEDSFKNLRTAKKLGLTTVFILGETAREENANREEMKCVVDACINAPTLSEVEQKLPWLLVPHDS